MQSISHIVAEDVCHQLETHLLRDLVSEKVEIEAAIFPFLFSGYNDNMTGHEILTGPLVHDQ